MAEKIIIRTANDGDVKNIFDISNDDLVRSMSIHQNKIAWEDHVKWFSDKLKSKDSIFYILEVAKKLCGYCRLDRDDNQWFITIHLASNYRHKGLGRTLLNYVCEHNTNKKIIAYVKDINVASQRLFKSCGFEFIGNCMLSSNTYQILKKKNKKNVIAISNLLYEQTSLKHKPNIEIINKKEDLTFDNLNKINPEYVFFPHWSYIIPSDIYNNFNCVIFHMTDLPFGRGGSPLQNLISRGIYKTKISALKCTKELDAGDIYLKKDFDISYGSAHEIYFRAGEIISQMIDEIINKHPIPQAQTGNIVEFKRRHPSESNISDIKELKKAYDYIRMLDAEGYPNAFIETDKLRFEFTDANYQNGKLFANVRITEK